MTRLIAQQPAPADYYERNLDAVLTFVLSSRRGFFSDAELAQLDGLAAAPVGARRLMARLLTRKGPLFLQRSLNYAEVVGLDAALAQLATLSLISVNHACAADRLLGMCRKTELTELWPVALAGMKSKRKAQLIERLCACYCDNAIRQVLSRHVPWLVVTGSELIERVEALFFGVGPVYREPWTSFVLQDLSELSVVKRPVSKQSSQFESRRELEDYLKLRRRRRWLDVAVEQHSLLEQWLLDSREPLANRSLERGRSALLYALGHRLERAGRARLAVRAYRYSDDPSARERLVRVLHRAGRFRACERLLTRMSAQPATLAEQQFARRFPGRHPTPNSRVTTWQLTQPTPPRIEAFAADQFRAAGSRVWHSENLIPRLLFGLVYWRAIFEPIAGSFVHPFQLSPLDLNWPDFYSRRSEIFRRERHVAEQAGSSWLVECWRRYSGLSNAFVPWSLAVGELTEQLASAMPIGQILAIADHVARNAREARAGFPDLAVIHGKGCVEFVEVKGPNDQLQPNQRVWLRVLDEHNIGHRVLKFRAMPAQSSCNLQSAGSHA